MSMWKQLRSYTEARIGLGQSGASLPTQHLLEQRKAEALARDALFRVWPHEELALALEQLGQISLTLSTAVQDRQTYLARPDWGRRLSDAAALQLALPKPFGAKICDTRIVFCVSDGLSAEAIHQHLGNFLSVFLPKLERESFYAALPFPFVLLPFARVAAADHVGELLGSQLTVIFVGERPGLSSHDSMGIYLSYGPLRGKLDGERNCISNVRPPHGLSYELATAQLCYLIRESLRRELSGVDLKMESETQLLPADPGHRLS